MAYAAESIHELVRLLLTPWLVAWAFLLICDFIELLIYYRSDKAMNSLSLGIRCRVCWDLITARFVFQFLKIFFLCLLRIALSAYSLFWYPRGICLNLKHRWCSKRVLFLVQYAYNNNLFWFSKPGPVTLLVCCSIPHPWWDKNWYIYWSCSLWFFFL